MSQQNSTRDIEKVVWEACEVLIKSGLSRESHFSISITLFMLKFFSDLALEKRASPEAVRHKWPLWNSLKVPSSCDWIKLQSDSPYTLAPRLIAVVDELETLNRAMLEGVFRPFLLEHATQLDPGSLYAALMLFSWLDLRPSSLSGADIGEAYEGLLKRFSDHQGAQGEFYVPEGLALLMAHLTEPQEGESIYDPFCRSGQLLTCLDRFAGYSLLSTGQAVNFREASFAKLNMLLHQRGPANIVTADAISSPLVNKQGRLSKFDVIVSNPPFGKAWAARDAELSDRFGRFKRGLPPKSMADYAYILHIVESMDEESGRAAVVVSHGALFRGGSEAAIRQKLIQDNLIEGIVALPANLFSATAIPVAVMVFRSKRNTRDIFFVDATGSFGTEGRKNSLRDQDVNRIALAFKDFAAVEVFCRAVPPEEIEANGFNLSVFRYIEHKKPAVGNLGEIWAEIQPIEKELTRVREEIDATLERLGMVSRKSA